MNATAVWEGSEDLRERLVPLGSLTRHPLNPRIGDVPKIAESLARFGQTRPILAEAEGTIIAGNHTYLAAESLGWTHVAVVRNQFASPEEARAYLLADNRLGDLGEYDRAELVVLVAELEAVGRWEGTGYTADDLEQMRALEALAAAPPPDLDDPADPPPPVPPPTPPPPLREVVLLFEEEQQAVFGTHVRTLRARYDLEGVTDTVLRVLHDEAMLAHQAPA